MAILRTNPPAPPIRLVRVQIGDQWEAQSTTREYTAEEAAQIAVGMARRLAGLAKERGE